MECMASRTIVAAERKRYVETPPLTCAPGKLVLIHLVARKIHGIVVVFFHTGGHRENIRVEDDVVRIEFYHFIDQYAITAWQISILRS